MCGGGTAWTPAVPSKLRNWEHLLLSRVPNKRPSTCFNSSDGKTEDSDLATVREQSIVPQALCKGGSSRVLLKDNSNNIPVRHSVECCIQIHLLILSKIFGGRQCYVPIL